MGKTEKLIFYSFIFLLPFQVGRFAFSFAPLALSFYHQFFIYLSDILIMSLWGFWARRLLKDGQEKKELYAAFKKDFLLILFLLFAGLSFFMAGNKGLAFFHYVKLFEFVLFYFYIRQNFKYMDIKKFSYIFIGAALAQVFISGLQFYFFQQSIGGLLRYFGESPLSPAISGVAKIDENGFKLIRAYGTFPHPNILAAFLIFAALMTHYDALSNASFLRGMRHKKIAVFMTHSLIIFAVLLGLFLTFSKIALASFAVVYISLFVFYYLFYHPPVPVRMGSRENANPDSINSSLDPRLRGDDKKECGDGNIRYSDIYKIFFITFIIFTSLFTVFNQEIFSRFSETQSISQRIFYGDIAQDAISDNPLFGVGVGNFVDYFYRQYPDLPDWQYQPAHNLFLLIASETGIIGALLFICFILLSIYRAFNNKNKQILDYIVLFVFIDYLILANFDHYFWTLQQGQILLWLTLGLLNSRQ